MLCFHGEQYHESRRPEPDQRESFPRPGGRAFGFLRNILGSLTLPAGVLFNFSTMDPHMRHAYSEQGSFEIASAGWGRIALSARGYQHVRGLHLIALAGIPA